ncbi:3-hydroxyisobutyrate dehydrogenase [Pseudarthrobacter sp. NPDC058196]|uniref:3-hydroxyisobutyrate dehydrogenase n=1 Tax=Pseudarthrobacter sp. NPDC058196 TaxID=3346376 RepID=UPI0036D8B944
MTEQIAFIGLGHMGLPMAINLARAGYPVTGFDLMPAALAEAGDNGVSVASSAAAAAKDADVIITMLPAGRHVLAAYQGETGLLTAARPNSLFIDCSTISVEDARSAHELITAAGHHGLDAPVSGGVVGAAAGTLTFMVGGNEEDFATAKPVLEAMGKRTVHCGTPGAGQAAKVCNNMILAVSMIAVSEGFVLGEQLGLSHQALFDVAANATGQCWALTTNCPVPGPVAASPANRGYQPGFAAALMAKDLGLAAHALESTGVDARLGAMAEEIYRRFAEGEGGQQDFSAIINEIRANSKTKEAV